MITVEIKTMVNQPWNLKLHLRSHVEKGWQRFDHTKTVPTLYKNQKSVPFLMMRSKNIHKEWAKWWSHNFWKNVLHITKEQHKIVITEKKSQPQNTMKELENHHQKNWDNSKQRGMMKVAKDNFWPSQVGLGCKKYWRHWYIESSVLQAAKVRLFGSSSTITLLLWNFFWWQQADVPGIYMYTLQIRCKSCC